MREVSWFNTSIYKDTLKTLLKHKVSGIPGIAAELRCAPIEFEPDGVIEGSSEKYLEHEFEWYDSMDLSIILSKKLQQMLTTILCAGLLCTISTRRPDYY